MSTFEQGLNLEVATKACASSVRSVWKRAFWWFQAVVTCVLLVALGRMCDWDHFATIWTSSDPRLWLACVVLLNLSLLAGGMALLILIRSGDRKLSSLRFLLDYAHVQSLCQVTPGQIGEALLPYMPGSATVPPGAVAAGLLLQRIVAVLIVALIAVCSVSSSISPGYVIAQICVLGLACFAITYLISRDGARARFNAIVGGRFGPILNGFYSSWMEMLLKNSLRGLLPHVCMMTIRFAAIVLAYYVLYLSVGITIPVIALTGILATSTLATLVPISLNGLGVVEAIMVFSLRRYGISSDEVLSVCVMGRSLWMLVLLNWSLVFWWAGLMKYRSGKPAG